MTPTTASTIAAMGGTPGNPTKFTATYDGHEWHAAQIDNEIHLVRMCTGCWSERNPGMWSTRRHTVSDITTVADLDAYDARTARLRSVGETEIADERDSWALRIVR
jgi:hypothetical protein